MVDIGLLARGSRRPWSGQAFLEKEERGRPGAHQQGHQYPREANYLCFKVSVFSSFIHFVACISLSFFLLPNKILLYGHTTFYLSIHQLTDIWMDYFHFRDIMNNAAKNIDIKVFVWNLFFISLEVKLLDHMVTLCLAFWRTARLLSKMAEPFYIHTSNERGFDFSTYSQHLLLSVLF